MKEMFHTRSSVKTSPQHKTTMKTSTLILLPAAACFLSGCVSGKIGGVNPTVQPAKLVDSGWKSSWSRNSKQLVYGKMQGAGLEVLDLRTKYGDVPMSLADACLVRMSEILPDPVVLTTDADFKIYRRHSRQVVPCLLP